ncbi:MAG TPA: hypothetical protein VME24_11305 [Alphaproteobacteria bacterium]|nr:hypothetical protein [Alphaproteobacteria bacterium]
MKAFGLSIYFLLLGAGLNAGAAPVELAVARAPAHIELRDQFNVLRTLSFPATNIILITIADWKGSGEVSGWVAPVKRRFGGGIDIRGIADVSVVPGALRGLVKGRFRKAQTYPVMMDWTGHTVKEFHFVPGKANILVLDRQGRIVYRTGGKADAQAIQDLFRVLDQAIETGSQTKK